MIIKTHYLIEHYEMIRDAERVNFFRKAIDKVVREDDIVVDIGTGAGILALLAAEKASKVYAIEVDHEIAKYARTIFDSKFKNKIILLEGDAEEINMEKKANVVICEMIGAALISEQMVPVINHIRRNLAGNYRVIPQKVTTGAQLINSNFDFSGYKFKLPHYQLSLKKYKYKVFTKTKYYHTVNFDEKIHDAVDVNIQFKSLGKGTINSIKLISKITMCAGIKVGTVLSMNWPLVYPIDDVQVNKGDAIKLALGYTMGSGLNTFRYDIKVVPGD